LDFVETAKGIRLMELELIEPYLFFDYQEGAADGFEQADMRQDLSESCHFSHPGWG